MPGYTKPKQSSVVPDDGDDEVLLSSKEEEKSEVSTKVEEKPSEGSRNHNNTTTSSSSRHRKTTHFADGAYVRIASAADMDRLPSHRWTEIFGPKAAKTKESYKLWAGYYADIDGEMDDRDRSYCIRNVKRLNPGSVVADIDAGAWWPVELLSSAGKRPPQQALSPVHTLGSSIALSNQLAYRDIEKLSQGCPDSNKQDCMIFWKNVLQAEPDVCGRRHPYDQETLIHKLVRVTYLLC